MAPPKLLCPSSPCEDGAILLGIVLPDGRIAYSGSRVVVDDHFVRSAREQGAPEKRFRFSGTCVQGACKQWSGSRCGVIDEVMEVMAVTPEPEPVAALPACSIRSDCRWYRQAGGSACRVCPEVVTDARSVGVE